MSKKPDTEEKKVTTRRKKPGDRETFMRRIQLLQLIPKRSSWNEGYTTAQRLKAGLNSAGFHIDEEDNRTVQRDLNFLESAFGRYGLTRGKRVGINAYSWYWSSESEIIDLPGMSPRTALTFFLVERFLEKMMPTSVFHSMEHHFRQAKEVLNNNTSTDTTLWTEKIEIAPPIQKQAIMNTKDVGLVYQAILEEKPFRATYNPLGSIISSKLDGDGWDEKRCTWEWHVGKIFHPYGIFVDGEKLLLISSYWVEENNTLSLPHIVQLHKLSSVELLNDKLLQPDDDFKFSDFLHHPRRFSLAMLYMEDSYWIGDDGEIHLLLNPAAESDLISSPISNNQHLSNTEEGRVLLKATVKITPKFIRWLRGWGDEIEVVSPEWLRKNLLNSANSVADLYGTKQ